jgi:hypothetical protein
MKLFSGDKNTIGTPNLLEKFEITIYSFWVDKKVKNKWPVIL